MTRLRCTSTIPLSPLPRPASKEPLPSYYANGFTLHVPRIVSVSFPLMETLGGISYNYLQRGLRNRIVTERYTRGEVAL